MFQGHMVAITGRLTEANNVTRTIHLLQLPIYKKTGPMYKGEKMPSQAYDLPRFRL